MATTGNGASRTPPGPARDGDHRRQESSTPALRCARCGHVASPRLSWQRAKNGATHLRADCSACGRFLKFAEQRAPWLAAAPARTRVVTYDAADPARALVTVLEDAMRAHPDAAREVLAQELGELERGEDEDAA